jgi:hypothetical protein
MEKAKRNRPRLPELWGPVRVAQELGVKPQNLYGMKKLPEPAMKIEPRGSLWYAAEIREFRKKRDRAGRK